MPRTRFLVAAVALTLAIGGACSDDEGDSEADLKAQLSETLQSGGDGFDEETADSFADIVIDEVGVERLQDVDLSADEPPEELQEEIASAAVRAADECDLAEG